MKKLYLLAAAALTLAACTDEAYLGENKALTNTDNPIGFNMSTPAMSRADMTGKTAADALGGKFYVDAIKNEKTNIGTIEKLNANDVMDNYVVTYADGSAFTTTSNTEGWEYVGNKLTAEEATNVTPNGGSTDAQTIKYWDWGAADYTFTAISALGTDITNGDVKIVKNRTANTTDAYKNGYTLTISDDATFSDIYIADRVNIVKPTTTTDPNRTDHNVYGGQVNFTFRSLGTKVRAGMYETVPGYTVTVNKMYGAETAGDSETNFAASCPNTTIAAGKSIEATVTYIAPNDPTTPTNTDVVNHPTVTFANPEGVSDALQAKSTLTLGTNIFAKTGTVQNPLLTTAAAPTYDTADGAYTFVLPQETNTTDMKVKVDYTLKCDATGEVIKVVGATATVPAAYLQWKPNFSYTYLFKISDNTNGHTDPGTTPVGPEGLYPITFDAVVVDAGDGIAEYITTVSDPSITTFGVDAASNKYVKDADAYKAGTDVYATVGTGTALTVGDEYTANINLYTVEATTSSKYEAITEAEVAEALAETSTGNWLTLSSVALTDANIVTAVPAEDGTTVAINALKIPGVAKGTYAVEYVGTKATKQTYKAAEGNTLVDGTTYYISDGAATPTYTAVPEADLDVANIESYYVVDQPYVPASGKQYKVFTVTE